MHNPNKKRSKKTSPESESGNRRLVFGVLYGIAAFLLSSLLLLLLCSGILLFRPDPGALTPHFGLLILLLASFSAGFTAEKRSRMSPLPIAILTSGILTLLTLSLSYLSSFAFPTEKPLLTAVLSRSGSILFTAFGTFLATYQKPKKRRKKRR